MWDTTKPTYSTTLFHICLAYHLPTLPRIQPTPWYQNLATTIVPTVQLTPVANVATDSVSNILIQILTSVQQIQQLLIQIHKNQTVGGGKTIKRNNRCPSTR